mgnify:CR=1 FL=1
MRNGAAKRRRSHHPPNPNVHENAQRPHPPHPPPLAPARSRRARRPGHPAIHRAGTARHRRFHRSRKLGIELRRRLRVRLFPAVGRHALDSDAHRAPTQRSPPWHRHGALSGRSHHPLPSPPRRAARTADCHGGVSLYVARRDPGGSHRARNALRRAPCRRRGAHCDRDGHTALHKLLPAGRKRNHRLRLAHRFLLSLRTDARRHGLGHSRAQRREPITSRGQPAHRHERPWRRRDAP